MIENFPGKMCLLGTWNSFAVPHIEPHAARLHACGDKTRLWTAVLATVWCAGAASQLALARFSVHPLVVVWFSLGYIPTSDINTYLCGVFAR